MGSPFLIAQLSDPHIGAEWADGDPVAGLAAAVEAQALGDVLAGQRQVQRIVAGHVHRVITGRLRDTPVLTVPSTYVQGA